MKITNRATREMDDPGAATPDELRIDLLLAAPSMTLLLSGSSSSVQLGTFDSGEPVPPTNRFTLLDAGRPGAPQVGVGRQIRVRFGAYASMLSVPWKGGREGRDGLVML